MRCSSTTCRRPHDGSSSSLAAAAAYEEEEDEEDEEEAPPPKRAPPKRAAADAADEEQGGPFTATTVPVAGTKTRNEFFFPTKKKSRPGLPIIFDVVRLLSNRNTITADEKVEARVRFYDVTADVWVEPRVSHTGSAKAANAELHFESPDAIVAETKKRGVKSVMSKNIVFSKTAQDGVFHMTFVPK